MGGYTLYGRLQIWAVIWFDRLFDVKQSASEFSRNRVAFGVVNGYCLQVFRGYDSTFVFASF